MSKYVFDENQQQFDIEDALTITKGKWADDNADAEYRIGLFVTSENENNEIELADADSYICGVTIQNDVFLGTDATNPKYCVVQSLGLCVVKDDGTLIAGDKCMPTEGGIATKSSNNLGYRVVGRVDDNHVQIIVAPNNDMVQRIKDDQIKSKSIIITTTDWILDEERRIYVATIAWEGVTINDRVDVNFDLDSVSKAGSVMSVTETGNDCFYMYAEEAVEETLNGVAYKVVISC